MPENPQDKPISNAPTDCSLNSVTLRIAIDRATSRWLNECRDRIPGFVDDNFGLRGSFDLHRSTIKPDLLRSSANLFLALPHALARMASDAARAAGHADLSEKLASLKILLNSDLGREITWRIHTQLFLLPIRQDDRQSTRDGLLECILAEKEVQAALSTGLDGLTSRVKEQDVVEWLEQALMTYTGSRSASVDLANGLLTSGAGMALFHKPTPGMVSLSTRTAKAVSTKIADGGLAKSLGGGLAAKAVGGTVAATTAGVLVTTTLLAAAFSGILLDPIQARFGIHQKRLSALIDGLEQRLADPDSEQYAVKDHYAARILDMLDMISTLRGLKAGS